MRIWGFDVGTTSIGFAVIDYDSDRKAGRIERLGVRIFPEGVTEDKGEPRNAQRRAKRMMRRQLRRKRWRRRALHEILAEAGLLPTDDPKQWPAELAQADPYDLRDRGLSQKLSPHEVGRALFHILKRRGFQSARIAAVEPSDPAKEKEDEGIKAEISQIAAELQGRTLGQWLKSQSKRRGHHTARTMTQEEFERFWTAQVKYHPDLLTDNLRAALAETAFRQRPIFWRLKTLGTCLLEKDAPLCPKGAWIGQRFEMLQTLNNLRLAGGNARPLDEDERRLLLAALETSPSLSFPAARKLLKPVWQRNGTSLKTKFNFEVEGGKKALPGNALEAALIDAFGEAWNTHPKKDAIRAELQDRLWAIQYRKLGEKRVEIRDGNSAEAERQRFIAFAQTEWNASRKTAETLSRIEPPAAWLRHSIKAIQKLLPHMEAGLTYAEARKLVYPEQFEKSDPIEKLPSDPRQFEDLRNPTVKRALTELRKVVNNLLTTYGKPERIRIELARNVALTGKDKANYMRTLAERERQRKQAAKELKASLGREPTAGDIEKWLLWQECEKTCPYTFDSIGFADLFGNMPRYDIEHIWPRSLSLDDSFANKTLCRRDVNNKKGQRTPFELYASNHGIADLPDWEEVKIHLRNKVDAGHFPESKWKRFTREQPFAAADDRSDDRLIGDTAYIAREARAWLGQLMPRGIFDVEPRNGRIVSRLRKLWHLDRLLGEDGRKNRDDHRHHALDAAVTALFDTRAMQDIVRWYKAQEDRPEEKPPAIDLPWPAFRDDLRTALEAIVVSHRVRRKVNGPLHDETRLGDSGEPPIREGGKEYRFYVKRKALAQMSKGEIDAIRDERIRTLAQERLAAHDGDVKKAFATPLMLPGRAGKPDREVKKARVIVKSQPHLVTALNGGKAYAAASDNHHMAIYRSIDGKVSYRTVSRIEAARRTARKEPVVQRVLPDGAQLLFTLTPGTTLAFPNNNGRPIYRVVTSVWDSGQIVLVDHTEAGGTVWKRPNASSLVAMGAKKVSVDPIGRVRPARD